MLIDEYIAGVDPGKTGAISLIPVKDNEICGPIAIHNIPYDIYGVDIIQAAEIFKRATTIVIELVHTMKNQGIVSSGKFMKEFGMLMGAANIAKHNYDTNNIYLVDPRHWKHIVIGSGKHDKDDSINKALEYVDKRLLLRTARSRVLNDGRAEAILIGLSYLNNDFNPTVRWEGNKLTVRTKKGVKEYEYKRFSF